MGDNTNGQLGDRTTTNRPIPVQRNLGSQVLFFTPAYISAGVRDTLVIYGFEHDL